MFSCGWSDCGSVALSGVPVVTDVPVSPSYAVAVMSEDLMRNRRPCLSPESVQSFVWRIEKHEL